jgi:hypothetical protein
VELNAKLSTLVQIALRSRYSFDIWWAMSSAETRPKYVDTMNKYVDFFRFDSLAHKISFTLHLSQLYEVNKKTLNLGSAIKACEVAGVDQSAVQAARLAFAAADATKKKVGIVRSNVFAHRTAAMSFDQVFELAAVTPNQLRELTEVALRTLNPLLAARGLQTWEHFPDAYKDTIAMLDALGSVS